VSSRPTSRPRATRAVEKQQRLTPAHLRHIELSFPATATARSAVARRIVPVFMSTATLGTEHGRCHTTQSPCQEIALPGFEDPLLPPLILGPMLLRLRPRTCVSATGEILS
jgi:hypothetical protein